MVCKRIFALLGCLLLMLLAQGAFAQGAKQYSVNSVIVQVEGGACLGQEHSRAQTEKLAMAEAKRLAAERVQTQVSSKTEVLDGKLVEDLVKAYAKATVRILEEVEKGWKQSDGSGGFVDSCYHVKIKAEVVPARVAMPAPVVQAALADPKAPLTVELWTGKDTYRVGDAMKFYFRANKPFYARAVYKDVDGGLIEVTPYGKPRYYQGGVTYEIPGQNDRFSLVITPPLGREALTLYGSTQPLGSYTGKKTGDFYVVNPDKDLGMTTRGLAVVHGSTSVGRPADVEFAETSVVVKVE